MKTFDLVLRLTAALIAIGAAIYAIAKYGDKLVAWAKKFCPCTDTCHVIYSTADEAPEEAPAEEAPVEEAPAEEAPVEEAAAEEAPVEEAPAEEAAPVEIPEGEPVAEEADFAE